jgi:hypothetical protein
MQNYWKVYKQRPNNPFNDPFFDDTDPLFGPDPFSQQNEVKDW